MVDGERAEKCSYYLELFFVLLRFASHKTFYRKKNVEFKKKYINLRKSSINNCFFDGKTTRKKKLSIYNTVIRDYNELIKILRRHVIPTMLF